MRTIGTSALSILIEALAFADHDGWVLDAQFMERMGSQYLLAHGKVAIMFTKLFSGLRAPGGPSCVSRSPARAFIFRCDLRQDAFSLRTFVHSVCAPSIPKIHAPTQP